jgi:hypothetical protein
LLFGQAFLNAAQRKYICKAQRVRDLRFSAIFVLIGAGVGLFIFHSFYIQLKLSFPSVFIQEPVAFVTMGGRCVGILFY